MFFKESASSETKALGFQICGIAISKVPAKMFKHVFTTKMLNCFANQIGGEQRLLHEAAKQLMEQIRARAAVQGHEATLRDFIVCVSEGYDATFDVGRTKKMQSVIEEAIHSATLPALRQILDHHEKVASILFNASAPHQADRKEKTKLLVDQIGAVFDSKAVNEEADREDTTLRCHTLRLVFRHACLAESDEAIKTQEADMPFREIFRAKMWSCIKDTMSAPRSRSVKEDSRGNFLRVYR